MIGSSRFHPDDQVSAGSFDRRQPADAKMLASASASGLRPKMITARHRTIGS
jgi:hypothetical protein